MENTPLSILIVEDDFDLEPVWTEIFKEISPGAKVTWTASIVEAESLIDYSILKMCPYDLIVSDIFVSGSLTGIDLLSRYQTSVSNRILVVTGADPKLLKKYLGTQYSKVKVLGKPFTKDDGLRAVNAILGKVKNTQLGPVFPLDNYWI